MKKIKGIKLKIFSNKSAADGVVLTFALIALLIVALFQFYMFFWMIYTSLKDDIDVFLNIFGLPRLDSMHFENYASIFYLIRVELFVPSKGYVQFGLDVLFRNSMILALCMPIQGAIVTAISAYIFSKYRFVGRELMLKINFLIIVLPIVGNLASSLKINNMLGRYDNLLLMCIMGAHPFTGLSLLIQMSFFNAIPKEMMEAAETDGATHFQCFYKVHLPIVMPTILLYYMLAVFSTWNDYMTPLIWLPSMPNLALGIFQFQYDAAKYAATLPQVLAGFMLLSVPSIVFYLINQRFIVSRMVMAGIKQ